MRETHAERAYRAIRRKLESGELAPGMRLVNRTLAKEIGTSPIPVREALNRLASEGLLAHVSGAGVYVRRPDLTEMIDLYGLREALELYAVREAVRNVGETELATLRKVCETHRKIAEDLVNSGRQQANRDEISVWMDGEERFHSMLVASTRNRLLMKTVKNLRLLARVFDRFRGNHAVLTTAQALQTCREHEGIVEALERRDVEAAERLISLQMANTRSELLHRFSEPPIDPEAPGS